MPLHTQREEDIKEFDKQFMYHEDVSFDGSGEMQLILQAEHIGEANKLVPHIKRFISNIYIKIAEEQRKRWLDIFKYHADSSNELHLFMRNTAHTEIDYWQEELNKLK